MTKYRYYVLRDDDCPNKYAKEVSSWSELQEYNGRENEAWGVFWTFNEFEGKKKDKNKLTKVNFWACDIDEGAKEEQLEKLHSLKIPPSIIVESKRGFHAYWRSKESTTDLKNYDDIVYGICKELNADIKARDPLRFLRVPNFYHKKDPNNPFLIKIIEVNDTFYTEGQMLYAFKIKTPKKKPIKIDFTNFEFTYESLYKRFKVDQIKEGGRNDALYFITRCLEDDRCPNGFIRQIVEKINQDLYSPLSSDEVDSILKGRGI